MVKFPAPPHPLPLPLAAPKPKAKRGPRPRILRFKPFPFPLLRGWRLSRLKSPPFPIRSYPCILSILRFIPPPRCLCLKPLAPVRRSAAEAIPSPPLGERVRVRWLPRSLEGRTPAQLPRVRMSHFHRFNFQLSRLSLSNLIRSHP